MSGALIVKDLRKEYPTPSEPLRVLRGVSFELAPGDAMAVMGPSGSGKSTLLHLVGTLDRPTAGTVTLDGTDPFTLGERRLAAFRNRQIGFVFQDHYLLPQCTALENVLVPTLAGARSADAVERAEHLLQRVGLADRMGHRPAELSGGERQRVAIARALVNRPALLLADEPTGNLDRQTAASVADLFFELQQDERPILLVVTHNAELANRFPRRAELVEGVLETVEG